MTTPVILTKPPTQFTIVDPVAAAEGVTAFTVSFGRTAGGPYPTVCQASLADVTAEEAAGTVTAPFSTLTPVPVFLAGVTYYGVASATNATGTSTNSPEYAFLFPLPVPSAPTAFSIV